MIPYKFILDEDADYIGKWDPDDDLIVINPAKASSICELLDTIFHEDIHALVGWATNDTTTADEDHKIIRCLGFE